MSESKTSTTVIVATVATVCTVVLAVAQSVSYWRLREETKSKDVVIEELQLEIKRQSELRSTERTGRIAAQKQDRDNWLKEQQKDGYSYMAVGHVETPFPDRRGTPRQPILVPAAVGRIRFNKQLIQFEHYEELKLFSHVWILFVFHNNTNTEKANKVSKIKPPRLHGAKVGCLSTRSPHRPNNIGLSVCEIVSVTKDYIELAGVDLVDGTPIIDIKPYIPYDMVPSDYVLPMATSADGRALQSRKLSVPDWVVDSDIVMQPVRITEAALQSLEAAMVEGVCRHYKDVDSAVEFITQVLRQDIRGVHQGRGSLEEGGDGDKSRRKASGSVTNEYNCRLDNLNLDFVTTSQGIEVTRISY